MTPAPEHPKLRAGRRVVPYHPTPHATRRADGRTGGRAGNLPGPCGTGETSAGTAPARVPCGVRTGGGSTVLTAPSAEAPDRFRVRLAPGACWRSGAPASSDLCEYLDERLVHDAVPAGAARIATRTRRPTPPSAAPPGRARAVPAEVPRRRGRGARPWSRARARAETETRMAGDTDSDGPAAVREVAERPRDPASSPPVPSG